MRREIYCPNHSELQKAEDLAKEANLPITIGTTEQIERLNIDKDIVQFIQIPEYKYVDILSPEVPVGFHQRLEYVNDFCDLDSNAFLHIGGEKVKPLFIEKHRAVWSFVVKTRGEICAIVSGVNDEDFKVIFYGN